MEGDRGHEARVAALSTALAGAGGTVISVTAFYPLLNISMRMQVDKAGKYRTTAHALIRILREEGLARGLYSGWGSAIAIQVVAQFIFFYVRKYAMVVVRSRKAAREQSAQREARVTFGEDFLVGLLSGVVTVMLTHPIWVVNTRQTVAGGKFFDTLLSIVRAQGPVGLFAGLVPALILCTNPAIQHVAYDRLKQLHAQLLAKRAARSTSSTSSSQGPVEHFCFGALAKIAATLVTYPYLTIKSRQQVAALGTAATRAAVVAGQSRALRLLLFILGLYNGLTAKLLQTTLTSALMFMMKEQLEASTYALARRAIG
eukprot:TRINITY_DN16654_c0_g1_i1.p1 TRINITY_DN16654_c0_g1~~TRINITY_DN16654_c0_g1_i1.p1  ORF type:complete len:315 (-),score=37.22 TRINITY_DN16654_c0_g1_i1:6-950(-)